MHFSEVLQLGWSHVDRSDLSHSSPGTQKSLIFSILYFLFPAWGDLGEDWVPLRRMIDNKIDNPLKGWSVMQGEDTGK